MKPQFCHKNLIFATWTDEVPKKLLTNKKNINTMENSKKWY